MTPKLHGNDALSSTEAELGAAVDCVCQILCFRYMFEAIGYKQINPTIVREDNTSTIAISRNPMLQSRVKHMEIKQSFLRNHQGAGNVKLKWVETINQRGDLLTNLKPLSGPTFKFLRDQILVDVVALHRESSN